MNLAKITCEILWLTEMGRVAFDGCLIRSSLSNHCPPDVVTAHVLGSSEVCSMHTNNRSYEAMFWISLRRTVSYEYTHIHDLHDI